MNPEVKPDKIFKTRAGVKLTKKLRQFSAFDKTAIRPTAKAHFSQTPGSCNMRACAAHVAHEHCILSLDPKAWLSKACQEDSWSGPREHILATSHIMNHWIYSNSKSFKKKITLHGSLFFDLPTGPTILSFSGCNFFLCVLCKKLCISQHISPPPSVCRVLMSPVYMSNINSPWSWEYCLQKTTLIWHLRQKPGIQPAQIFVVQSMPAKIQINANLQHAAWVEPFLVYHGQIHPLWSWALYSELDGPLKHYKLHHMVWLFYAPKCVRLTMNTAGASARFCHSKCCKCFLQPNPAGLQKRVQNHQQLYGMIV